MIYLPAYLSPDVHKMMFFAGFMSGLSPDYCDVFICADVESKTDVLNTAFGYKLVAPESFYGTQRDFDNEVTQQEKHTKPVLLLNTAKASINTAKILIETARKLSHCPKNTPVDINKIMDPSLQRDVFLYTSTVVGMLFGCYFSVLYSQDSGPVDIPEAHIVPPSQQESEAYRNAAEEGIRKALAFVPDIFDPDSAWDKCRFTKDELAMLSRGQVTEKIREKVEGEIFGGGEQYS